MKDKFTSLLIENENLHEFALWAFGDGYGEKTSIELMHSWNELHPDLVLFSNSLIGDDAPKMVDLWRQNIKSLDHV